MELRWHCNWLLKAAGCALLSVALFGLALARQGEVVFERSALTPDRYQVLTVSNGPLTNKIRALGSLRRLGSLEGVAGWFEYDFVVPDSDWYSLSVLGAGNGIDFTVDPERASTRATTPPLYGTSGAIGADEQKVGNLWLAKGSHVLRLERLVWSGFPNLLGLVLRRSSGSTGERISIEGPSTPLFRIGGCEPMTIRSGPLGPNQKLEFHVASTDNRDPEIILRPSLARTESQNVQSLALPCARAGSFTVSLFEDGTPISPVDVKPLEYEVFDTAQHPKQSTDPKLGFLQEIDAATTEPPYFGGSKPEVTSAASGPYRESGTTSWFRYQRLSQPARVLAAEPSWFAYTLGPLVPQHPYLIEVEYPDDAPRSFVTTLRERAPLSYPVSFGVETGTNFRLTGHPQKMRIVFWPRTVDPRLVVLNAHDGERAAISHIRVFAIEGGLPTLSSTRNTKTPSREFLSWYEEGENFLSVFGAPDASASSVSIAAERWAEIAAYSGATTLVPTSDIYAFAMYPSRVDRVFATEPGDDRLRRILMAAERHQLSVIPELHPRGDFLSLPYLDRPQPMPHLLVDKDGHTDFFDSNGQRNFPPHHNPIFPANQRALLELVGEMASRYRDSPAFEGISLRLMTWANATLNNFGSLDWGYDDYTVSSFVTETGAAMPGALLAPLKADDSRARLRYQWIMQNVRARWIDWRCEKIAELYRQVRDRLRQIRPDLRLYSSIFVWSASDDLAALREAGIDPVRLGKIDGVELVNAMYTYGNPELLDAVNGNKDRFLSSPEKLSELVGPGQSANFLTSASYFETTDAIVPPAALGFSDATRATWSSTAVSPSGRSMLARMAIPLAQLDAQILGDGGNMYTFGQNELRDFLADYSFLPRAHFDRVPPTGAAGTPTVAVWTKTSKASSLFYVVNPTEVFQSVHLRFSGPANVRRLSDHSVLATAEDGRSELELAPFQLKVFEIQGAFALTGFSTTVPGPPAR